MWERMAKLALVSATLATLGLLVAAPDPAAARGAVKQCACGNRLGRIVHRVPPTGMPS